MVKCNNCGVVLYALNMSDNDASLCQKCDEKIVNSMLSYSMDTTLVLWDSHC